MLRPDHIKALSQAAENVLLTRRDRGLGDTVAPGAVSEQHIAAFVAKFPIKQIEWLKDFPLMGDCLGTVSCSKKGTAGKKTKHLCILSDNHLSFQPS